MDEDNWYSLVSVLSTGTCVLMLGPAAVTGQLNGEHLPVHVGMASYMKQRLPEEARVRLGSRFEQLDPWKPATVAQVVLRETDDPAKIRRWVEEFHSEFKCDEQPIRDLAALGFELVLNTSPDTTVFELFSSVKPGAQAAYYDRTGRNPPMLPDASREKPVIYQLYGAFDNPRSMILSDSDRLDFIVKVARANPALPVNLTSTLHDPDRSFLFLGFDLSDWHFKVLLHILSDNARRNYVSFASELESGPVDMDTRDFYRTSHKVHFFSGDLAAFCEELKRRYESEQPSPGEPVAPAPVVVSAEAPVVFICHASEDAEMAREVAEGLRAAGIGAWLDKDNLRGGVSWNDMIEHTLKEEVQYVTVLQSAAMFHKDVGYVNKEINIALDRQSYYRPGRAFLIPAIIDDPANMLDAFTQLQSVNLVPPAGVGELVKAIRRDLDVQARGIG
jgi:hypothetical protein